MTTRFAEMVKSESNPFREYEVIIEFYDETCKSLKRISCNCPGWLYPKNLRWGGERTCKHTKRIKMKYGL